MDVDGSEEEEAAVVVEGDGVASTVGVAAGCEERSVLWVSAVLFWSVVFGSFGHFAVCVCLQCSSQVEFRMKQHRFLK